MSQVTVVMLGDAHAGKTLLARKLVSVGSCEQQPLSAECEGSELLSPPYRPTIGADRLCSSGFRYQRSDLDVVVWDYPGNERLRTVVPTPKVSADVCLLVLDATNGDAMQHLDAWHDEYLHMCSSNSVAPPMFVVALTKSDIPVERRAIDKDQVASWCSREFVDPTLWPRDIVAHTTHVPPVVEVSALSAIGINALLEVICHRGLLRQALTQRLDSLVMDATRDVMESAGRGLAWCGAVVGDVRPLPFEMYTDAVLQRVETDSGALLAWNAPHPMLSGNTIACRLCHVGIINVKVSDSAPVHNIRLWQEVVMREGHIRDSMRDSMRGARSHGGGRIRL